MLALFLLAPLFRGEGGSLLLALVYTFVVFSAAYTTSASRRAFRVVLLLLAFFLLGQWLDHLGVTARLHSVSRLSACLGLLVTLGLIVRHLFRARTVTFDLIMGSICGYLLIGVVGGLVFTTLEGWAPGSFRNGSSGVELPDLTYYSFVAMTTLGFGDVVPTGSLARSLTILLAVAGQFYMATLVAMLVGAFIAERQVERNFDSGLERNS
jgi:hypothetical protein